MNIDPAAIPKEVKEALLEQSPADNITTMKIVRLWESIRGEALDDNVKYKIHDMKGESQDFIQNTVDGVVTDMISFIKEFTYTPDEENLDEAFQSFQSSFEVFARAIVSVRVAYAILRGVEVTESGLGSVDEKAMDVGVVFGEHGPEARMADTATEQEKLVWRASWVVQAALDCEYRNLTDEEREYINWVGSIEPDAVTSSTVVTLESLLLKMQPNYYLFTKLGEEDMHKFQVDKTREAVAACKKTSYAGLATDEVDYIKIIENTDDTDIDAHMFANMSRFHVKTLR